MLNLNECMISYIRKGFQRKIDQKNYVRIEGPLDFEDFNK